MKKQKQQQAAVRHELKWQACPKCGSENFLVGATKTLCNMCDWETTEYPYTSSSVICLKGAK